MNDSIDTVNAISC